MGRRSDFVSPQLLLFRFVVNVHANYTSWAGAAMQLLQDHATTPDQISAVLGGTAMKVYRV